MGGRFDCAERSCDCGCEINPTKVDCFSAPPPNNGMHPTANSAAFIRQLECLMHCARRVMPGVRHSSYL